MKNAITSAGLLIILFSFTGCIEVEGELTTAENISLNRVYSDGEKDKVVLSPDIHKAKLSVESDHFILKVGSSFFDNNEFIFNSGTQLKDIKNGDTFYVTSKASGQPYDVQGAYFEALTKSKAFMEIEICEDDSKIDYFKCRTEVNRALCQGPAGKRKVTYQNETTVQKIKAQLLSKSKRIIGTFLGSKTETIKNVVSYGQCIRNK